MFIEISAFTDTIHCRGTNWSNIHSHFNLLEVGLKQNLKSLKFEISLNFEGPAHCN